MDLDPVKENIGDSPTDAIFVELEGGGPADAGGSRLGPE